MYMHICIFIIYIHAHTPTHTHTQHTPLKPTASLMATAIGGGEESGGRSEHGRLAPGPGLRAARGSLRASGRASAASFSSDLSQIRERPGFVGVSVSDIHITYINACMGIY